MKVGDLVKMPQDEGYAIVMEIIDSHKPIEDQSVKVLRCRHDGAPGFDWWALESCEAV